MYLSLSILINDDCLFTVNLDHDLVLNMNFKFYMICIIFLPLLDLSIINYNLLGIKTFKPLVGYISSVLNYALIVDINADLDVLFNCYFNHFDIGSIYL